MAWLVPDQQVFARNTACVRSRTSMPMPLNHANVAVVEGNIYVIGGLAENSETERAWRPVGDSWVYLLFTDIWSRVPSMPAGEGRGSAAVGVYDGKIYLAAGLLQLELFENGKQESTDIVSIFNTRTRVWEAVPKKAKRVPEARDHAGAAVVGGKMYVLGGRKSGQENVRDTVFVLDLSNVEAGWSTSSARMPTAKGGVSTGTIGHRVYVIGGEGNKDADTGVFDQVEVYDTKRDSWESAGRMQMPRHGTSAVAVGGRVCVPGGGTRQSGAPVSGFDAFTPKR
jgi:N-acetylneuraminic acid mutarotase